MNTIHFQTEGAEMPELDFDKVMLWLPAVAASHGYELGRVTYCFCSDEYILEANRQFIGHDYYTDVITFDYTADNRVNGDVLISIDTVASNAEGLGVDFTTELLRVVAHGVLHLCGIDDKGPGEREIMEAAENQALALYCSL